LRPTRPAGPALPSAGPSADGATQGGDLDFAPWHAPQARKACGFWPDEPGGSSQGTRRAEPDVVVAVRRPVVVAVGGTRVHSIVVERAATQHTANRPPPCGRGVPGTTAPAVDRYRPGERGCSSSSAARGPVPGRSRTGYARSARLGRIGGSAGAAVVVVRPQDEVAGPGERRCCKQRWRY
jgi:hypothetical protein